MLYSVKVYVVIKIDNRIVINRIIVFNINIDAYQEGFMDFFVPSSSNSAQAESVFSSIAQHIAAPSQAKRIHKLQWKHEGEICACEVGESLPEVFRTDEKVLAIFDCGDVFKVCTPSRGAIKFDPIHASKSTLLNVEYFD